MKRESLIGLVAGVLIALVLGRLFHRSATTGANDNGQLSALQAKIGELENDLQFARADNAVLRAQMARNDVSLPSQHAGTKMVSAASPGASPTPASDSATKEDLSVLTDSLKGDKYSAMAGAGAMMDLLKQGTKALPQVMKAFHDTKDPKSKVALLPVIALEAGKDIPNFVKSELPTATDPQLRDSLMRMAAINPALANDPSIKQTFYQALNSSDGTYDAGARVAAIHGLKTDFSQDTANLLLSQATSSDESVRLAAIEALSIRPGAATQLQNIIANDPSPQVRQIGQCQMLLGQRPSW